MRGAVRQRTAARIIIIENRHARGWQRLDELVLRGLDIIDALEALQMLRPNSGQDTDAGMHEIAQFLDVSPSISPHLSDEYLVAGVQTFVDHPTNAHHGVIAERR